jgi:glycerophosphoryl diester phosphodiesterase
MTRPRIVAHRGASAAEPENTLPAFERAIALGADMVEFDVRRTADGVLVVHHDAVVTGESPQAIATLPWADLHQTAPHIPTLEAVLRTCAGRIDCDVELKEPGYETEAIALVQQYLTAGAVVLTSFHTTTVGTIKAIAPNLRVGWLVDESSLADLQLAPTDAWWATAIAPDRDFLAPHHSLLAQTLLQWAKKQHPPLWTWTVNDPEGLRSLLQTPQIEAVITDYPERAIELYASPS